MRFEGVRALARLLLFAGGGLVVIALLGGAADVTPATADPFARTSSFRQVIAPDAEVQPNSSTIVDRLAGEGKVVANLNDFGVPIFTARADTPTYLVTCTVKRWGVCPFAGLRVPVPSQARAQSGSDGAMVVIDEAAGKIYEFWQASRTATGWQTSFGAINDLYGSGWGGASTGSGASRLAGVVRVDELRDGTIDHALSLQSDNVCQDRFVAPALKTDGDSLRADCVPMGTRLRLDPAFNVDTYPGLSAGERAVARALQTYGGVIMDKGSARLSISFELASDSTTDFVGNVYTCAGFQWDYHDINPIPWTRLQILK